MSAAADGSVRFYRTGDPYGEFSNFAAFPFVLDGKTWPTSEHYFQARKFAGTPSEEEIRLEKSPAIAARMGYLPREITFLSDVPEELNAAASIGMACILVDRPGYATRDPELKFKRVTSFSELD